jgi:triosephosphate isomerase
MRRKIVAGNWKMNTSISQGEQLAAEIVEKSKDITGVELIIAPPFTHLTKVAARLDGSSIALGAQDCSEKTSGAYTGEVGASMIADIGAKYCILGHSERREYFGEDEKILNKKLEQCFANNLTPIFCVGEKLNERESECHYDIIIDQLSYTILKLSPDNVKKVIIAYEPIWAIGTGKTATPEEAQEMHTLIRQLIEGEFSGIGKCTPILYGGSCNPGNAKALFAQPDVDGGLIGGASLNADNFIAIAKSF